VNRKCQIAGSEGLVLTGHRQFAALRLLRCGAPRNDMTGHVLSSGRKTCLRERRHGTRLVRVCPRMEIPALRAGSFALWGHWHIGVLCTPGSGPGSTTGAVGGPKAVNSGWAIVQNKTPTTEVGALQDVR
jgi:hypothetical protein